jgi:MerR family transcriptional regulator/heat shock protein HspR
MPSDREKKTDKEEMNRPLYPISVVADMLDIHPQTIRLYEREGLIKPQRTKRNTRMFSETDVEQLKSVLSLTELGVNLAGVEIIMRMSAQIEGERERFRLILKEVWERYNIDLRHWGDETSTDLIPMAEQKIMKVKKPSSRSKAIDTIDEED